MKRLSLYILTAGAWMIGATACGDFLEEYSQDTSYIHSYTDLDELLLGDGYMPSGYPSHIGQEDEYIEQPFYYPYIHLMSDEAQEHTPVSATNSSLWDAREKYFGWYTWQQQVGIDREGKQMRTESKDWDNLYARISVANSVLAAIDDQEAVKDEQRLERQRIKGEAYFLRGAYYFVLANLYGKPYKAATAQTDLAVPIKTSEFIEDQYFERATVQQVYDQVLADLLQAEKALTGVGHKSLYRADVCAVQLLLSRVYLYMQDWANAATYAQKVIAAKPRLTDLNAMTGDHCFLTPDMSEAIFSMGNGGMRLTLSDRAGGFCVSDELMAAYDANDLRGQWFVTKANGYNEYVKDGLTNGEVTRKTPSMVFFMRSAEAYLNLAEATAYSGDEQTARKALNTLRANRLASAAYADVTASGSELVALARAERFRELCFEGHRWFDLRRYMVCDVQPESHAIRHSISTFEQELSYVTWSYEYVLKQSIVYELQPNDDAYTLPIPKEELEFNPAMPNNPRGQRPGHEK